MFLEILPALFHLHEHDGFPDQIGKAGAVAVRLAHAHFQRGAGFFESARVPEGLKEVVEKDLRFALFVAGDVLRAPRGEFGNFFPARHGEVVLKNPGFVSSDFDIQILSNQIMSAELG